MQESLNESESDQSPGKGTAGAVALVLRWFGALVSVGLLVGIVYWSVQLGQRDAQEIPVIRAMEGAAREAPDNPGGTQADHQGLAVNEVLAGTATTDVNSDTTLAPVAQPLEVEDEPIETLEVTPAVPAPIETPPEPIVVMAPEHVDASTRLTEINAPPLVHRAEDGMTLPLRRPDNLETGNGVSDEIESLLQEVLPEEGGTSVFVPEPIRPAPLYGNPRLDPGSALVQLGAFNSVANADAAWEIYQTKYNDLLGGLARVIAPIEAGGRVLYQLQAAGFDGIDQTRAVCDAIKSRGSDCISVTTQ